MGNQFGENLKRIRETKGQSQEQMAAILGTSKQVISRYETGQRSPKVDVASEYAKKLNVDLKDLTGWEESATAEPFQPTPETELSIEEEVDSLVSGLSDTSPVTMMLDGKPASPQAKAALRSALTTAVIMAREMEKGKKDE